MLRFPSVVRQVANETEIRQWTTPPWQEIVDRILAEWADYGKIDVYRITQRLSPDWAREVTALALEGESLAEADCERMATDCLSHLRRRYFRALERKLRSAIRAAEERKDETAKRERILEWQDVVQKERQLERRRAEAKISIR
jgi:hypothetical protein